ncbi:radical SAM protein [Oscillibacter sp.]|uniref:SPL family radical SAM protein n=1 Tax=Oscillibacter sp. TaxID=1945593 RepID=UPI00217239CA|nr:radical SAM protein [Oscillibacter sp.]MCI9649903.1 radical SAM protein [Oscillibacter sp.]
MHEIRAKSILSSGNGINIYRGCTHGCIYCDSRSACYQMDHAFEDVAVKVNAPELLEDALRRRRRRCMIGTGSMCDPYLPLERETRLTRRCLEVIDRQGFGVSLLTKSDLVLRDLDLLRRINQTAKAVVCTTFTTFDEDLCRVLEPRVCTTRRRFETLKACREAGVRTGVWLCPILPFLNDTEENLRGLLEYCFAAGVEAIVNFGMGVTLREGDREYFYAQLDRHFPGMKERYIRAFGNRYECLSPNAPRLERIFREECRKRGVLWEAEAAMGWLMEFEDRQAGQQLDLFS